MNKTKASELKHAHFNVIYDSTKGILIFSYKGNVIEFYVHILEDPDYWNSVTLDGEVFDLNFFINEPMSLTIYSLTEEGYINNEDYLNINFIIK